MTPDEKRAAYARIDVDERGDLDDIAIPNVTMFRMEWMDSDSVWICAYTEDKPDGYRFWLHSSRKIRGHAEDPRDVTGKTL